MARESETKARQMAVAASKDVVLPAPSLLHDVDIDTLPESFFGLEGKVDKNPKTAAIILAGGSGERFGREGGKQLAQVAGKPVLTWSARIAALLIAGYGVYALIARQMADYLFGKTMFAFFDTSEPVVLFLLDYLAIMGTFVFAGHYLSKVLKLIKRRKTT